MEEMRREGQLDMEVVEWERQKVGHESGLAPRVSLMCLGLVVGEAVDIATRGQGNTYSIQFLKSDQSYFIVGCFINYLFITLKKNKLLVGLLVTPVRPCVTFHNLAKWAKQSRERLRIQSCHLEPG
jgi:hypothetical protein